MTRVLIVEPGAPVSNQSRQEVDMIIELMPDGRGVMTKDRMGLASEASVRVARRQPPPVGLPPSPAHAKDISARTLHESATVVLNKLGTLLAIVEPVLLAAIEEEARETSMRASEGVRRAREAQRASGAFDDPS